MIAGDAFEEILRSLPARRGHFVLESGYHTDLWLSLDGLFIDPKALASRIVALADLVRPYDASAVCGPLLGGAFLAQALATHLDIRFYYAQQMQAPSGGGLFAAEYRLPAGLLRDARQERFAVVDDVISAGSSVRSTAAALRSAGAPTVVVGALLVLGTATTEHFACLGIPMVSLGRHGFNLWTAAECPQCHAGMPLEDPVVSNMPDLGSRDRTEGR
jgi:orotate phosphoribosyltransferase